MQGPRNARPQKVRWSRSTAWSKPAALLMMRSFWFGRQRFQARQSAVRAAAKYTLDSSGRAIVDRVQPYLESNVQVTASSLPLDANVGKLENRVRVPAKAGVVIDLAINRTKAVTFRLIFDGKPAPVGGVVEFGALKHPVGLDGLVYIQDTGKGGDATARVGGRSCRFRIPEPPEELVPDPGELTYTSQAVPAGSG